MLAVVVLFLVSFWLVSQLEQKRRLEFMRARVASAIAAGSALAFAGLGFTAVFREGFETVLFYQALAIFAEGLELWVVLGAVTAAVALGVAAYAVIGLGKRLPFKQLLFAGATTLLLLSVAFAGNAVRSLQEAALDPGHADRRRLGAAADLPRRADRHPPDARGDRGAGRRSSASTSPVRATSSAGSALRRRAPEAARA